MTLAERYRFWCKVRLGDGCWEWVGAKDKTGYGRFAIGPWREPGRARLVHRLAYEDLVGPIPPGLVLDHLCRSKSCVKPAHLDPVTQRENIRRGNTGKHWAVKRLAKEQKGVA